MSQRPVWRDSADQTCRERAHRIAIKSNSLRCPQVDEVCRTPAGDIGRGCEDEPVSVRGDRRHAVRTWRNQSTLQDAKSKLLFRRAGPRTFRAHATDVPSGRDADRPIDADTIEQSDQPHLLARWRIAHELELAGH